jgi:hypothetical protein
MSLPGGLLIGSEYLHEKEKKEIETKHLILLISGNLLASA